MNENIQYIKHKKIDKSKWDRCISESTNGIVFAYSWYLDSVFSNWDALILNDYEAVFPLPIKSKFGLKYMFNPMFTLQLGLFGNLDKLSKTLIDFINKIPSNIRLIDYNLNSSNNLEFEKVNAFVFSPKSCQYIDLNQSIIDIQKGYSTNLKRNLSKANKNNLTIVPSKDVSNVVSIFRDNRGNMLHEISEIHYIQLEELLKKAIYNNVCFIFESWFDNELLASAAFTFTNNRIIYIKGGSSNKGRELNAMHLIMNHVIEKFASQNIVFDFGGSSIIPVINFNKQFGAEDYFYTKIYKNNIPFPLNLLKK